MSERGVVFLTSIQRSIDVFHVLYLPFILIISPSCILSNMLKQNLLSILFFMPAIIMGMNAQEELNDMVVSFTSATASPLNLGADPPGYVLYTEEQLANTQVSNECKAQLLRSVKCDNYTLDFQQGSRYRGSLNEELSNSVCDPSCRASLERWFKGVEYTCASQLLDGAPATKMGGCIWAGWNETCLRDPQSNQLCNGELQLRTGRFRCS